MKHILVTGGAGYIGAQTCKLLRSRWYLPVTFDNLSTGPILMANPSSKSSALCKPGRGRGSCGLSRFVTSMPQEPTPMVSWAKFR